MDKDKAMQMIKDAIDEIPYLRTLRHGNQEFELWYDKVRNILEAAFGKNSWEHNRFIWAVRVFWGRSDTELQEAYNDYLDKYETSLKSIIQKYELLGTETKPAAKAKPQKAFKDYKEKAANKELELILQGTPDMIMECIRSTVEELNSQGHRYGFRKTSGAPNYAKWDKTYFASCNISQGDEGHIGTVKLQLIPNERTLFKIPEPKDWDSSFGVFLSHLVAEFKQLGFVYFEEEKPPIGFKLPHREKNV